MLQTPLTLGTQVGTYGDLAVCEGTYGGQPARILRHQGENGSAAVRRTRLQARSLLDIECIIPFMGTGDVSGSYWMATERHEGPPLPEWIDAVNESPAIGSAVVAARLMLPLATSLRRVYQESHALPGGLVTDVVLTDSGIQIGSLGELSAAPRLEEAKHVTAAVGWLQSLAGDEADLLAPGLNELSKNARLAEFSDFLEHFLEVSDADGRHQGALTTFRSTLMKRTPMIAAPALPATPEPAPNRQSLSLVPTAGVAAIDRAATPAGSLIQDVRSGSVVGNKYRLVRSLGGGSMGHVFEAVALSSGQPVAVKIVRSGGSDQAKIGDFFERFKREVAALSVLHHPNVVQVHDSGTTDICWLAMELVDGPSLASLLGDDTRLPLEQALQIGRQMCAALAHAHSKGIVHRDVKPANILVSQQDPIKVKLADFGLAKSWDDVDYTANGTLIGTPQYMSPEQCTGKPTTQASDIYGVGVVLFRMIAGTTPFAEHLGASVLLAHSNDSAPLLGAAAPDVNHAMAEVVVARCLAKAPDDRYESAEALDADLARCLVLLREGSAAILPADVPPPPVLPPAPSEAAAQRPSRALWLLPLLLLVGAVIGALALWLILPGVTGSSGSPTAAETDAVPAPSTPKPEAPPPAPVVPEPVSAEPVPPAPPAPAVVTPAPAKPAPAPAVKPRPRPKPAPTPKPKPKRELSGR